MRTRAIGGAAVFLVGCMPLFAKDISVVPPGKAGLSEQKIAEINKFMEGQVADKKIAGGIVVISHDGKIGHFRAYGQMDIEAKKR